MAGTQLGGSIAAIANSVGQGLKGFQQYSANAASRANGVSAAAQRAQGNFNQSSANNANAIGTDRIAQQYGFNSGMAAMANDFSAAQFERAMQFNAEEAQKNRDWQERMMNTAYQRSVKDMEKAGLNPILAVTGGGISTGSGSGSAASVSAPSGAMASGGLMNGISASEGNYTGQMEYMGGMLGLLSAALSGLASAQSSLGQMGTFGEQLARHLDGILNPKTWISAENGSLGAAILDQMGVPYNSVNQGSHGHFSDFKNIYRPHGGSRGTLKGSRY